jgi:membrane protein DedA with SNARE-associated domain
MWSWIAVCAALVAAHPWLALFIAFAAAIIEAVAVLGILIPGTPILMAVAGAAAVAGLPMLPFLIVSIVGAIIGDFLSFWFGQRYSTQLRGMWPFRRYPRLILRAEVFFHRYGPMSVALCRFVPVLRSTVPLVAGMAGMKRSRFLVANLASAFVWAPVHVLPAQFAGVSIERIVAGDWNRAAFAAAGLTVMLALAWCLHRTMRGVR